MKHIRTSAKIIFIFLFACCITIISNAHSGRTDANGGHYNHSTGEYHYHHGRPAHQHINGECKYDFNNQENNKTNSETTTKSSDEDNEDTDNSWMQILFYICIGGLALIGLYIFIKK